MEQAPQTKNSAAISKIKQIVAFILELNWFLSASAALLLFILLKKFVFDIGRVNSHDMNATYGYGDALLIRKSTKDLQRSDVVQFSYPMRDTASSAPTMIQRIYGLPGDTVLITAKKVIVNSVPLEDTSTVQHNYFVRGKTKLDSAFRKKYNLWEGGDISDHGDYSFSLTQSQVEALRQDPAISSVELKSERKGNWDESIFPTSAHYRWNLDHYGPLYIPKAGDTLQLDTVQVELFEMLIRIHEKNALEVRGDSIFINGHHTNKYVVKKDYYFVLGDNRDNASDSRTWGYLPDNYLRGKAVMLIRRARK